MNALAQEPRHTRLATALKPKIPGLAAAAVAVGVAFTINRFLPALSPLTIAVILGAILGNIGVDFAILKPGLKYAAKKLLRAGIVVLGLKLSIGNVLHLGGKGLAVVVIVVAITFFGTQLLGKALGVSPGARLLIATGFSICGASAVAAMDGVTHNDEDDVITAIALVTMCGSLAIVVLPLLQHPLGLSPVAFGTWVGASVHDVAQVVATASVVGPAALAPAVIVKLTRVVLLAPMVAGMSIWRRFHPTNSDATDKRPPIIPLFVAGFLVMVAVRSTGILPTGFLNVAQTVETILLAAALFGLGSSVHLKTLFTTGGRALALALASWVTIAAVAYGGVLLVGA